jgi:capsular polysaccharide biosynthesis protein
VSSWRAGTDGSGARANFGNAARLVVGSALIVLCAVASAVFFGTRGDKVYGGRADIVYLPGENVSDDSRERILATHSELIHSRAVLQPVADRARVPLQELEDSISVEIGRNDLLRVTAGDEDPVRARGLAEAVAQQYVRVVGALSPDVERTRRLIERRIADLSARVPNATEADAALLRDRIGRLQDQLVDLEVQALARPQARMLSRAYMLSDPLWPKPLRAAAIGLLVGLALATTVVLVFSRWRPLARRGADTSAGAPTSATRPADGASHAAADASPTARSAERAVIAYLREHGPTAQRDLAQALGIFPTTMRGITKRMVRDGVITRNGESKGLGGSPSPIYVLTDQAAGHERR